MAFYDGERDAATLAEMNEVLTLWGKKSRFWPKPLVSNTLVVIEWLADHAKNKPAPATDWESEPRPDTSEEDEETRLRVDAILADDRIWADFGLYRKAIKVYYYELSEGAYFSRFARRMNVSHRVARQILVDAVRIFSWNW